MLTGTTLVEEQIVGIELFKLFPGVQKQREILPSIRQRCCVKQATFSVKIGTP